MNDATAARMESMLGDLLRLLESAVALAWESWGRIHLYAGFAVGVPAGMLAMAIAMFFVSRSRR